ncbi:hypothetical protein LEP1GSC060_3594 [Leptospira weilii serovar Ranarum str. ICFT]|uniref:Uncharacterized protein n=1 Tax=Leptospira weilii serovar Ranarum str. ICFT TaxID=1218598 RepID=N1WQ03_9LEPT|nr:hypothetical protein [Leptospira weilii]EMY79214.1 hypothetical protein LEP1GSC060_3594 [Leptospira weilii serovar Ranarum str. ICFT]
MEPLPPKSLNPKSLFKRILQKMGNFNETELSEVEAVVDSILNAKFESFMDEFALAVGLDRPPLSLVKSSRRKKSKKN